MLSIVGAIWLQVGTAVAQSQQFVDSGNVVTVGSISEPPDYYGVQRGDTLWEISSTFLGNPYYWPQLWSINEQVTNPHWIYPGNRIVFRRGTLLDPPELGLEGTVSSRDGYVVRGYSYEKSPAECGPNTRFEGTIPADQYQSLLFLSNEDDLAVFGEVSNARPNRLTLSERDLIYMDVGDPQAFDCGDIVQIIRRQEQYENRYIESTRLKNQEIYKVIADVQVVHRHEGYVSGVIRTSYDDVWRGDLVAPARPVSIELEVSKPRGDLDGLIVARSTAEKDTLSVGDTVFIDRGRADGVRVGNAFYIVEHKDPVTFKEDKGEGLPESVIGRIVIVRVDDYNSTAVIADADRNIEVGQRVAQFLR